MYNIWKYIKRICRQARRMDFNRFAKNYPISAAKMNAEYPVDQSEAENYNGSFKNGKFINPFGGAHKVGSPFITKD